ncbi:LEAF RUST 10 DISEASE-RESISTANCE LOCUS RECEPTOR-LIKE PROTEIN KINASE-like 2.1 [Senna tora]|uniref:non-specific serine/threonine protein kinase n=1 Tax=Senna tora TaxID=362788 RepID=A0A834TSU0_9FABA|nr:LEAF RUST 10 DISEASE-RESISTANCE LOCUS RECEPTOR-LIKE PROTEIN KINASE-like 2.1 [Senna tora]
MYLSHKERFCFCHQVDTGLPCSCNTYHIHQIIELQETFEQLRMTIDIIARTCMVYKINGGTDIEAVITSIHGYIITSWSKTLIKFSRCKTVFQSCEPKTCGNGQNISYPFYIDGKQDPSCGFPRFGLTCAPDGFPILNLTNTNFIVQQIFYHNHSLRVSDPQFSISNATTECLSRSRNLTLFGNRYEFAPKQKEILLFFDCATPGKGEEEYRVGCDRGNRTRSVLAMDDGNEKMGYAMGSCRGGFMKRMVMEEEGGGGFGSGREGIWEALRRGFVLVWKVTECEGCEKSGGRCGFDMDAYSFMCYCPDGDYLLRCHPYEEHGKLKVIAATVSAVAVVGALIIVIYCFSRKLIFHKITSKAHQDFEAFLKHHGPLAIRRYSYSEIKKMTNSFKDKLGQGGYGSVFKGTLHEDCGLVAVKVLNETKGNGEEFINEVASISRTSHVNIVSLLGFCFEGSKKALVYEFMANGSLEKFIYNNNSNQSDFPDLQLSCEMLYKIAMGVARGLEYLHRGCNTRILHFDIKPHNILLDENFFPKISDFGLAKICPRNESIVSMLCARGTIGYIAPEVISRNFGEVSHKSDVYSFGMMILEMVGRRRNVNVEVDRSSEIYFPQWIYKRLELNQELALKSIRNEGDRERMRQMVIVSLWCIQTNPLDRPMMSKVVEMLEGRVESLQVPPKPYLSSPPTSPCPSSSTN